MTALVFTSYLVGCCQHSFRFTPSGVSEWAQVNYFTDPLKLDNNYTVAEVFLLVRRGNTLYIEQNLLLILI